MNGGRPSKPIPGSIWRLSSMGVELAAAVLGGCALGYVVDRHFNTGHWGLIVGALVGIVGGLYNMVRKALLESLGVRAKTPQPRRGASEASEAGKDEPPEAGSPP